MLKSRIKFAKKEPVKFLSHLELVTCIRRAMLRTGLPLIMTHHFSPQPKISFGPPLPVGYTSVSEFFDVEFGDKVSISDIKESVEGEFPEGFEILDLKFIFPRSPSLESVINIAKYAIKKEGKLKNGKTELEKFRSQDVYVVTKETEGKKIDIDVKPLVIDISIGSQFVDILLRFGPNRNVKPDLIIQKIFELSEEEKLFLKIQREGLYVEGANKNLIEV